jgi:hypothetical protein
MKNNHRILSIAILTIAGAAHARADYDPFEAMQKSFETMEKEMHEMMGHMSKMHEDFFDSWYHETHVGTGQEEGMNVSINEQQDNSIKIAIAGIKAEQFEANFTNKELDIKAPLARVNLSVHHNVLGVTISQEVKQESKEELDSKSDTGKGSSHYQCMSSASSHVRQMLSKPINLEDARIEYAKESKTLTVTVPAKESSKQTKSIPVNVVGSVKQVQSK